VLRNTVYHQTNYGIQVRRESIARENQVYDNSIGIEGINQSSAPFYGLIENNLVYENLVAGIRVHYGRPSGSAQPRVWNNTIYQSLGDGLCIQGSSNTVDVRNNIIRVDHRRRNAGLHDHGPLGHDGRIGRL
jgi:parallel beta-helix repeat protein